MMEWNEIVTDRVVAFAFRWLHVIAGIMWIGHLWYFNFTQTPTMPKIPQELRPGVARYILPEALFWFRWGAMVDHHHRPDPGWFEGRVRSSAITIGLIATPQRADRRDRHRHVAGRHHVGQCLVHHLAEPEKEHGPGAGARRSSAAAAARIAGLASRVNTMLSIPMLYGMTSVHFY